MEILADKRKTIKVGSFEICELEIWASVNIKEFRHYRVSNMGRVMGQRGKLLKKFNNKGYDKVTLCNNTFRKTCLVHRIVATTFIHNNDSKNKDQVNHINGIKDDNRVENLEWVSQWENNKHAYETGLANKQFRHSNKLYSDEDWIHSVYLRLKNGEKIAHIAKEVNVNDINLGQRLRDVYGKKHIADIYLSDTHTTIPSTMVQEAYELALLGRSALEIAEFFGVSSQIRNKLCDSFGKEHIDQIFKETGMRNRIKNQRLIDNLK